MRRSWHGVEIGHADVPDQAALLERGHGRPALLDVLVRDRPVDLVQVDRVHAEPPQTALGLAQDRVALEHVPHMPGAVVQQRALGEHVGPLGQAAQRPADDLLGAAETVGGRGVDPVDPELHRPVDGRDRLVILLRSPAELPATAADGPGAEANAADLQAGIAQRAGPELCLLHDALPSTETVLLVSDSARTAAAIPGSPEYFRHRTGSHIYETRSLVSDQQGSPCHEYPHPHPPARAPGRAVVPAAAGPARHDGQCRGLGRWVGGSLSTLAPLTGPAGKD